MDHEEGHHRVDRQAKHRGQRQRQVKCEDRTHRGWCREVGKGDQLADRRRRPDPTGHRLGDDAGRKRRSTDPGARQVGCGEQGERGPGHRREPDDRAVRHAPGQAPRDQDTLVETPVPDGRRPRQQQHGCPVREPGDCRVEPEQRFGERPKHGREEEDHHDSGDRRIRQVDEAPQSQQRTAIPNQRRGRAHHHDDRRLDDHPQSKGNSESGQLQPGGGERRPEARDDTLRDHARGPSEREESWCVPARRRTSIPVAAAAVPTAFSSCRECPRCPNAFSSRAQRREARGGTGGTLRLSARTNVTTGVEAK